MIRLNTSPGIREMNKLCYEYKRSLLKSKRKYLYNSDMKGIEFGFYKWLRYFKGIKDLNAHLANVEMNTGIKKLYLKRSKCRHVLINR